MKYFIFSIVFLSSIAAFGQNVKLTNAVVIAQFEKEEDRYAMQALMTDLLQRQQIKTLPIMNVLKQGEDMQHLLLDSVQQILVQKGFDTYVVVNVRGYDRTFKPSTDAQTLAELLETTSIYHIYRDEATSVSFEFSVYRGGKLISRQVLRCGNVSDRDSVLKRLRKRFNKKILPSLVA
jgi:hypothetical protein